MKSTEEHGQQPSALDAAPKALVKHELTREFYVKSRSNLGKKRNYVYNFAKARTCPHPNLVAMSIGGSTYRCTECNYTFDIVAANMQPLHNRVLGDMFNVLHFAKEFGGFALQEVLRTPIGQYDSTPHKPAIPDGHTILDALLLMDQIDVTLPDGGKAQVAQLMDRVWTNEQERLRKQLQLEGKAAPSGSLGGLLEGNGRDPEQLHAGERPKRQRRSRAKVPALSKK